MTYDAGHIANWFIKKAEENGKELTITKLLKLVYIAHGWHLGASGMPLIESRIEAWQYGPVIPEVYQSFRTDSGYVKHNDSFKNDIGNDYTVSILNYVYDNYGKMGARQLSDLTHEKDSPWYTTVARFGYFSPITNRSIYDHYYNKIKKHKEHKND